jgi:hypothetical protein
MQASEETAIKDEPIEALLMRARMQGRAVLEDQRALLRAEAQMRAGALQKGLFLGAIALCLGIVALNALGAALVVLVMRAGLPLGPAVLLVGLAGFVAAVLAAQFAAKSAMQALKTPSPSLSALSTHAKTIKETLR